MNADGSNVVRLTDRPESDGCAEWSPDGHRIAFISDVDGQAEVFMMNSDGGDVARLTDNSIGETSLSWSPDGTTLAIGGYHLDEGFPRSDIYLLKIA